LIDLFVAWLVENVNLIVTLTCIEQQFGTPGAPLNGRLHERGKAEVVTMVDSDLMKMM
jgi:hypothetical protein